MRDSEGLSARVQSAFQTVYGEPPQFLVRAPGRANLIGDHTDYNDGFVMPLAVNRAVWMAVSPRTDRKISIYSLDYDNEQIAFSLDRLRDKTLPHWTQYVRGAWWLLNSEDVRVPGASIVIGSNVPVGGGMSSSAAIAVASVELVLKIASTYPRNPLDKALLAVEIEQRFIGFPCGVMDQIASAAAIDHSVMLLDCRSLKMMPVPLSDSVCIVVIDSAQPRLLAESGYVERRQQCEAAAAIMGIRSLRDVTLEHLEQGREKLGELHYRRVRHVVSENQRVLAMKSALEMNDLERAGELINQSHFSLRDDYESSAEALDILTAEVREFSGCYGARIMGGGFGGCAVSLVQADMIEDFISEVARKYQEKTGLKPEFHVCVPAAGSTVMNL